MSPSSAGSLVNKLSNKSYMRGSTSDYSLGTTVPGNSLSTLSQDASTAPEQVKCDR